jgi:hypothetical protein
MTTLELAARQHPGIVLAALHDRDKRAPAPTHYDATCRIDRSARHRVSVPIPDDIRFSKNFSTWSDKTLSVVCACGQVGGTRRGPCHKFVTVATARRDPSLAPLRRDGREENRYAVAHGRHSWPQWRDMP